MANVDLLDKGLTFCTCACGWTSNWGTPDTAEKQYRRHRIGCTAMTNGATP